MLDRGRQSPLPLSEEPGAPTGVILQPVLNSQGGEAQELLRSSHDHASEGCWTHRRHTSTQTRCAHTCVCVSACEWAYVRVRAASGQAGSRSMMSDVHGLCLFDLRAVTNHPNNGTIMNMSNGGEMWRASTALYACRFAGLTTTAPPEVIAECKIEPEEWSRMQAFVTPTKVARHGLFRDSVEQWTAVDFVLVHWNSNSVTKF